jgi:hypothetical protein
MHAETDETPQTGPSPRITNIAWGRIETEDGRAFKDAKLWPGGGREWDWTETGTSHVPGIQPADVQELLEHGAGVVVLSRGQQERLQVPAETREWLKQKGVEVLVLPTGEAVDRYNELRESAPVGGLFHSTC